ncbi:MAG: hypothetical protein ACRDTH_10730 [Pseudonocardiaceae bacterium]
MTSVDELSEGLDRLRNSIAQTAQAAPQVARQEIHRKGRAYFRGAIVASVITSLLVGLPPLQLNRRIAQNTAEDQVRATQFQAASQDIRQLAQGAYELGAEANAELTRRGLATVPIPTPGTAPDSEVLSAASTAQGDRGEPGLRGEPPVGWTVAEADGSITSCERAGGFDPVAPRYQCFHGPPPSAAPPPPPSEGDLLPVPGG